MSQNNYIQFDLSSLIHILQQNHATQVPELALSSLTQAIDTIATERPKRCCMEGCKKKLVMTDFPCKCEKIHCALHRASELHHCAYDYKTVAKEHLTKAMPIVIAKKLDMI